MGHANFYKDGDWNAICDQCGVKEKASKLKLQWDGLQTCPKCFDKRHPQDFVRGVKDEQQVPFTRPDEDPTFTAEAIALTVTE